MFRHALERIKNFYFKRNKRVSNTIFYRINNNDVYDENRQVFARSAVVLNRLEFALSGINENTWKNRFFSLVKIPS